MKNVMLSSSITEKNSQECCPRVALVPTSPRVADIHTSSVLALRGATLQVPSGDKAVKLSFPCHPRQQGDWGLNFKGVLDRKPCMA